MSDVWLMSPTTHAAIRDAIPADAEVVLDDTFPFGVVSIMDREDYDRMLELNAPTD